MSFSPNASRMEFIQSQIATLREAAAALTADEQAQVADLLAALAARLRQVPDSQPGETSSGHESTEFKTLMDAVPALIWVSHDRDCQVMTANRAGYAFLRMGEGDNVSKSAPDDALQFQPYRNFKDGREVPAREMPMQVAAATGRPARDYEFDIVFEDGRVYHLLGNVEPLFDAEGQPAGAVGAFVDITQRKRAEQELRVSEERFRLASLAVNEGLWDWQAEGDQSWWNESYDQLYGPRPKLTGSDHTWWPERIHPDDRQRVEASYNDAIESGSDRWTCDYRFRRGDGSYADVIDRALFQRDEHGRLVRITGAMLDLTEQRRLEAERLEQATQVEVQRRLMAFREKERQEIARDIHDGPIQTLVSTIFSLQYLKEAFENPTLRLELEQVGLGLKGAVRELREVVNELRPPSLIRFGLVKAIRIHAEDFQEKHPELPVRLELEDDEGRISEPSSLALFRIYQEALNNVLRHAEATRVTVRFSLSEAQAVLEISDNGRGFAAQLDIPAQIQNGHFGLAGMEERAETIGGTFEVESILGQGSRIRVFAPLHK